MHRSEVRDSLPDHGGSDLADFFWFSDTQWARTEPLLPTDVRGKSRVDERYVLSGIVHALRSGGVRQKTQRKPAKPLRLSYIFSRTLC